MEKIIQIEQEYPAVNEIRINGFKAWPFYRMTLRYKILVATTGLIKRPSRLRSMLRDTYQLVHSFLREALHIRRWYRAYDYVIFSNNLERKEVDGQVIDKLASGIIEQLGSSKILYISYDSGKSQYPQLSLPHAVSGSILVRLTALFPKKTNMGSDDHRLLNDIIKHEALTGNGLKEAGSLLRTAEIVSYFLKRWRPKAVFTTCYSYYGECYAARQNNIPVIEIQHGLISPQHPAYASPLKIDRSFRANHLLTFGKNSTAGLDESVVDLSKVKVVGNLFLEKMRQLPPDERIHSRISGYNASVCVPTDIYTEEELVSFVVTIAAKNPGIVFLLVPRQDLTTSSVKKIAPYNNIIPLSMDFQNVVRHCSIHTATISTCCLEALSVGVPNILLDKDGRTKKLFGDLLTPSYTRFVSTPEQFIQAIKEIGKPVPEDVIASNEFNFKPNYKENLAAALKDILAS